MVFEVEDQPRRSALGIEEGGLCATEEVDEIVLERPAVDDVGELGRWQRLVRWRPQRRRSGGRHRQNPESDRNGKNGTRNTLHGAALLGAGIDAPMLGRSPGELCAESGSCGPAAST